MSDRTDNGGLLCQSVADMRTALENGPLGKLRIMLSAGAIGFGESQTVGEDLTDVLADLVDNHFFSER